MKKRLTTLLLTALLLVATAALSFRVGAAGDVGVSAAGVGLFPSSAQLYGIDLSGSTFGSGALIDATGATVGSFSTVLEGTDALGAAQSIVVEALITGGTQNADGSATLSGSGTVETGGQVLTGIPISVTLTTSGVTLTIGDTKLPTQTLSGGGITIK